MKSERGITLVSLVVTIIILIILAGISVNMVLGENGIIKRAQQGKENIILAQIEQEEQLNQLYDEMESSIQGGSLDGGVNEAKLLEFKMQIANYIEEAGGVKPEYTADTITFGDSIKGIVKEVTKDATATAEDIAEGKTAWVNGELITGNLSSSSFGIIGIHQTSDGNLAFKLNEDGTFTSGNHVSTEIISIDWLNTSNQWQVIVHESGNYAMIQIPTNFNAPSATIKSLNAEDEFAFTINRNYHYIWTKI